MNQERINQVVKLLMIVIPDKYGNLADSENKTLVNLVSGEIGIADRGIKGYTPTNIFFKDKLTYQEQTKATELLNKKLFGQSVMESIEIQCSTF